MNKINWLGVLLCGLLAGIIWITLPALIHCTIARAKLYNGTELVTPHG